jgi:hypothetical protein
MPAKMAEATPKTMSSLQMMTGDEAFDSVDLGPYGRAGSLRETRRHAHERHEQRQGRRRVREAKGYKAEKHRHVHP